MIRSAFHSLALWVCLIAFGIGGCLIPTGLVFCTDAEGLTRIEWGCLRDEAGACSSACDTDGSSTIDNVPDCDEQSVCVVFAESSDAEYGPTSHSLPRPCKDVPVKSANIKLQAPSRQTHLPTALFLDLPVADLPFPSLLDPGMPTQRVGVVQSHPPDALTCLRSVILTV